VISAGVVPRFVEFLVRSDYPQLQVEVYKERIVAFAVLWMMAQNIGRACE
jgi:hypothetical protein